MPALGTSITTRALSDARRLACDKLFLDLLQAASDASDLWRGLKDNPARQQHLHQLLLSLAHTTLTKYLRSVANFLDWLVTFTCSLAEVAWPCIADFLHAARGSHNEDRACHRMPPTTAIKSLRWFARTAQIASLHHALQNPLIASYAIREHARDRREAYPLPMAVVLAWERHIVHPDVPLAFRLWLGAALLCIHASLRWGDAQRVEWSSLGLTPTRLHGTCYKTKTSSHGQPFAVHLCGFAGDMHARPLLGSCLAARA